MWPRRRSSRFPGHVTVWGTHRCEGTHVLSLGKARPREGPAVPVQRVGFLGPETCCPRLRQPLVLLVT